jgi:two-component system OmpR family response regulator
MGDKKGVLVIDDDLPTLETLELMLEVSGYQVWTSGYARDATKLAREHRPDVILLDLMMPDADGFKVQEALNADPNTAKIPIVLISAHHTVRTAAKSMKIAGVLEKPFHLDELVRCVEKATSGEVDPTG